MKYRAWFYLWNKFISASLEEIGDIRRSCDLRIFINDNKISIDSLMEYTGIKDSSGKELYEGDIFKYTFYNGFGHYLVTKDDDGFNVDLIKTLDYDYASTKLSISYFKNLEYKNIIIIGNVIENENLIKETK